MQSRWFLAIFCVTLFVLSNLSVAQDDCSQYQTCAECLNVTTGSNLRQFCGWCHSNIIYHNGSIGQRCADIRQTWKCPAVFDTYYCSSGWVCDFSTGQCKLGPPGEGFPDNATCQQHCFPAQDTYLCNTTTYQCQKCQYDDPRCSDQKTACENCQQPEGKYKCDRSNATAPQCVFCQPSDTNCTDFTTACSNCSHHPPPPPPTPPPTPPPQPQKNYTCDNATLTCKEASTGSIIQECSATCSNSTPAVLNGTWRGIQVQKGFAFGEYDFTFHEPNTVSIKDPFGTISHGRVYVQGSIKITFLDGPHQGRTLSGVEAELSYGPETYSIGLGFGPYDGPVPNTFLDALSGNGQQAFVMSSCHGWSSKCHFNPVEAMGLAKKYNLALDKIVAAQKKGLAAAAASAAAPAQPQSPLRLQGEPISDAITHPDDPCNTFTDCKSCVGQHSGFQCGWCMSGTIVYNDTGDSHLKCGGYISGQPLPFICPQDFRTELCDGYTCNYTLSQPQCLFDENGQFSTPDQCQAQCKNTTLARCNLQTKQCESCTAGQPNCTQTEDECDASCNLQYQKCNVTTKQCVNCDRESDPSCKQSAGDCDRTCSQTNYGICDPISGKCQTCDPSQTGCVQNCNDTCSQVKNFYCNSTTFQCIIGGGNQTLEQCAENCYNSTQTLYSCVWNTSQPQCIEDPQGHFSKQDCETNCKQPDYAKCNFSTGMCEDCNPQLDPDCKYTQAYCNASCKPSEILGTWRGIQINQNYDYGEWDFTFNADQTVSFWLRDTNKYKYVATFTQSVDVSATDDGEPITLIFTTVPLESDAPIPGLSIGTKISGLYVTHRDEVSAFNFLYLALAKPPLDRVNTFDDGMDNLEWTLVGCRTQDEQSQTTNCDFTSAIVPEKVAQKSAGAAASGVANAGAGFAPKKSHFAQFYN